MEDCRECNLRAYCLDPYQQAATFAYNCMMEAAMAKADSNGVKVNQLEEEA